MSITVEGAPATITREAYAALIAGAGFDVTRLRKLEFRSDGIYAEVKKTGPNGGDLIDDTLGEPRMVVETVFVPIEG